MYVPLLFVLGTFCLEEISGHGMMVEPPNRSSLWRYYPVDNNRVVRNNDDNANLCGGFALQWETFKGKCGLCGDPYNEPRPRKNENTGLYGKFGSVRNYKSGSVMDVKINLTANHKGKFRYSLCVLDNPNAPESGEKCFQRLKLGNGKSKYRVKGRDSIVHNAVKLPDGVKCERCVLRWEYISGDKKGVCRDYKRRVGCGRQITFKNCADISIR